MSEPGSAAGADFVLQRVDGSLALSARHRPRFLPLVADWTTPALERRVREGRRQLLSRAVGLHRAPGLEVLDGTAGMGEDGCVLARLGARVTLMERQPIVVALLRDALARLARHDPGAEAAARLEVLEADARDLARTSRTWDVVYLDPMYPGEGDRHALPRKSMQILRELTGGDADADDLLAPALGAARMRVVVKRPAGAVWLAGARPHSQLSSRQVRYDVYLPATGDAACDA